MKKYILFAVFTITVICQTGYILNLKHELLLNKKYTKDQIKELLGESIVAYTSYSPTEISQTLDEPDSISNSDIIKRIEMLDMHLTESCRPSIEWLKNVNDNARREIIFLRNHMRTGDFSSYKVHCTRGSCTY